MFRFPSSGLKNCQSRCCPRDNFNGRPLSESCAKQPASHGAAELHAHELATGKKGLPSLARRPGPPLTPSPSVDSEWEAATARAAGASDSVCMHAPKLQRPGTRDRHYAPVPGPEQETPGPPPSGPRFPESRSRPNRETGIPCFPIPAELVSRFWPNRESGIPSPIPGQIGNRGNGNWGFGPLAHGTCHWHEPPVAATDVRWRPEISIFEDQRQHLAPGSCLVRVHMRCHVSIPDFPIFGQIGNRGFPDSRIWPNRDSGDPFPIPGGNPRFPAGIPDSRLESPIPGGSRDPIPGQIGNGARGNGNWGFPGLPRTPPY
jgi:hypothetical protein